MALTSQIFFRKLVLRERESQIGFHPHVTEGKLIKCCKFSFVRFPSVRNLPLLHTALQTTFHISVLAILVPLAAGTMKIVGWKGSAEDICRALIINQVQLIVYWT